MEWREKRLRWIERQREQDREQTDRPWPRKEGEYHSLCFTKKKQACI